MVAPWLRVSVDRAARVRDVGLETVVKGEDRGGNGATLICQLSTVGFEKD